MPASPLHPTPPLLVINQQAETQATKPAKQQPGKAIFTPANLSPVKLSRLTKHHVKRGHIATAKPQPGPSSNLHATLCNTTRQNATRCTDASPSKEKNSFRNFLKDNCPRSRTPRERGGNCNALPLFSGPPIGLSPLLATLSMITAHYIASSQPWSTNGPQHAPYS